MSITDDLGQEYSGHSDPCTGNLKIRLLECALWAAILQPGPEAQGGAKHTM